MNTTVARIVDLLFENVAESEEVTALHDEVMNNCQERYDDLRSRGLGEDEAIGEVVESLKGMDEVVRQYPRKSDVRESAPRINSAMEMEDDEEDAQPGCAFPFEQVRMLDVNLSSDDVELVLSQDDLIHVNWEDEEDEIIAELEDDTLRELLTKVLSDKNPPDGAFDNYTYRLFADLRFQAFGVEIPFWFLLIREAEIKNCRLIEAGLYAGLKPEEIRERVRVDYV